MAAYLALLVALAEMLAGDPAAAERAVRDAEAMVSGPATAGTRRWSTSTSRTRSSPRAARDAAAAVARIEAVPAPCDIEWVDQAPHRARAWVAARAGDRAAGAREARGGGGAGRADRLLLVRADAQRTLAEVLPAAGRTTTRRGRRPALALDERKGNVVAAAATRRLLADLGV